MKEIKVSARMVKTARKKAKGILPNLILNVEEYYVKAIKKFFYCELNQIWKERKTKNVQLLLCNLREA